MTPGTPAKSDIMHSGNEKTLSLTLGQPQDERQAQAGNVEHGTSENGTRHLGLTLPPANDRFVS